MTDEVRVHVGRVLQDAADNARGLELLLGIIEARGEGRVVRNKVKA